MNKYIGVTIEEVCSAFTFAKSMIGAHNNDIIMERSDNQIFIDDLRGKLAEIALKKYLYQRGHYVDELDFERYERGQWDKDDIVMDHNIHISVKSSSEKAGYLMIETTRFNPDGSYTYNNDDGTPIHVDYYAFLNIGLDEQDDEIISSYDNGIEFLGNPCMGWNDATRRIKCYLRGFISHEFFWNNKKTAIRRMQAYRTNLAKIWNGETVEPDDEFIENDKRWLQKDNYIYDVRELKSLDEVLDH